MSYTNKGDKFLKETVVLRRWESIAGNLVLTKLATVRVKKLTFRALALRQSDWRNCGFCVELRFCWEYGDEKTEIK